MKIGDTVYVHGYVDEIRKDTVIIRNDGGYFGTVPSEIVMSGFIQCKDCKHWRRNYYQDVETCFNHRNVDGTEQATRPEDFCSWGEPRENEIN